MSEPTLYEINFDNPIRVYHNGQKVSGVVQIETEDDIETEGILMKLHGKSVARLNRISKVEVHLLMETYIFGDGEKDIILPAGKHSFPFCFKLPINIPSSFEGFHGKISYYAACSIRRELFKFDYDQQEYFVVNSILDLRREPEAIKPVVRAESEIPGLLFFKSGPISAQVTIPKTGFIPGEAILISAKIQNNSSSDITNTSVKLLQRIIYNSNHHSKTQLVPLIEITKGSIPPGKSFIWDEVPLIVPQVAPSRLDYSTLIDLDYFLEFLVNPEAAFAHDMDLNLPILIGNVEAEGPLEENEKIQKDLKYEPVNPDIVRIDYEDDGNGDITRPFHLIWKLVRTAPPAAQPPKSASSQKSVKTE